jgi:hypothetical protein
VLDTRRKQLVSWNEPSKTDDFAQSSSIRLFPNPASFSVRLEWNEKLNPDFLEMLDVTGKQVRLLRVNGRNTMEVELIAFSNGLYLTRLLDSFGKDLGSARVLVQK